MNLLAKPYLTAAVIAIYACSVGAAYWLGSRSASGKIAADTVEELTEDTTVANEMSTETSEYIRGLHMTIADLVRINDEIANDCIVPDESRRVFQDAVSAAFPATR